MTMSQPPESVGPIPEDNLPGHHPEVEQDKPTGPPPTPKPRAKAPKKVADPAPRRLRSELRWEEPFKTASRVFGVKNDNAYVEVDDENIEIHFGPWRLTTPMSNVAGAQVTGPFQWWKVIGPAHLSFKDRGITFASTARQAVCIQFRTPVPAIDPRGMIRHPGATVTVKDPEALALFINQTTAVKRAA